MEFLDLGKHCKMQGCNQKDFLPFQCDGCGDHYCKEHRSYKDHGCTKEPRGAEVILCEHCGQSIKVHENISTNELIREHIASGNCIKVPINRCKDCKKKLTMVNSLPCSDCNERVCIRHRHKHICRNEHSCRQEAGWVEPDRQKLVC